MLSIEEIKNYQRNCFSNFMKQNKLKCQEWSEKSGVAESTIRHYLNGRNSSVTSVVLQLLAQSINVKISDLIDNNYKDDSNNMFLL